MAQIATAKYRTKMVPHSALKIKLNRNIIQQSNKWIYIFRPELPIHKRDSIQGTDYIANPFFLNLKVSRTTIKNLRWQFSGDIIQVTFRKSVTSLVPKLKKKWE